MTTPAKPLELNQDIRHTRREWRAERIGWALMVTFVLCGISGLLGRGPLSYATAGETGSTIWVEHERFARFQSPSEMKVHFTAGALREGKLEISMSRDFYEAVEMDSIEPEPAETVLSSREVIFRFATAGIQKDSAVTFRYDPASHWKHSVAVGAGGEQRQFWIFVLP